MIIWIKMIITMLLVITKLTIIKNLPSNNSSINSKDRSPNTSGLASKNIN